MAIYNIVKYLSNCITSSIFQRIFWFLHSPHWTQKAHPSFTHEWDLYKWIRSTGKRNPVAQTSRVLSRSSYIGLGFRRKAFVLFWWFFFSLNRRFLLKLCRHLHLQCFNLQSERFVRFHLFINSRAQRIWWIISE